MTACRSLDLEGGRILYGGPGVTEYEEHEHPETQLTIHLPEGDSTGASARAWVVPGGVPHKGGWKRGIRSVVFHFEDAMLGEARDGRLCVRPCDEIRDSLVFELGVAVVAEMESPWKDVLFFSSVHHVVARRLARAYRPGGARHQYRDSIGEKLVRRLRDFADANMDRSISVPEIARALEISAQRLTRQLKATTGQSPHQYITAMRIERAKELLKSRSVTLAEIAFRLGFASQSHFTAVFRRRVGVTPNVYRKTFNGGTLQGNLIGA